MQNCEYMGITETFKNMWKMTDFEKIVELGGKANYAKICGKEANMRFPTPAAPKH